MFYDLFGNIALGLSVAFSWNNLLWCLFGVTLGTLVGVLPGIGALSAISMLLPITYYIEPVAALIMMAGIYYGSSYGGSTTSILLNLPGSASSAVACLDGYPMAKQGRAGVALVTTALASLVGGSIGILIMMLLSPVIVDFALDLGPQEYFSLMVMGLLAASAISVGSPIKGIAMVVVGILLGLVGIDVSTGAQRFTFGIPELTEGFSIVVLALGLFGIAEIVVSLNDGQRGTINKGVTFRSMLPTKDDMRRAAKPMLRGTGVGAFIGALPGAGSTIASFIAYAIERKIAKDPERFGNGAIEGLAAPEAANNAGDQTAFIPTLTLGIPGSATMALMLNVLMIHGVAPGPMMVMNHADIFWGLVMSFWIGNVLLVILNLPMVGVWVRVLSIPYSVLFPSILMFVCIGAYTINYSAFDVMLVAAFGVLGYGMRLLNFPAAPLLLGFVLGPMMEEYFRRAMVLSRGDFTTFFDRPLSLSFLLISAALLLWAARGGYRKRIVA